MFLRGRDEIKTTSSTKRRQDETRRYQNSFVPYLNPGTVVYYAFNPKIVLPSSFKARTYLWNCFVWLQRDVILSNRMYHFLYDQILKIGWDKGPLGTLYSEVNWPVFDRSKGDQNQAKPSPNLIDLLQPLAEVAFAALFLSGTESQ